MMMKSSVTFSTFSIERTLKAPPGKVFRAFSDAALKKKWFSGPPDWRSEEQTHDFRVGGTDTSVGGPVGGFTSAYRGTYMDIVEPSPSAPGRIVTSYEMKLDGVRISVSLNTIELRAEGKGTLLVLTEQGVFLDGHDNPAGREEGTREMLKSLAKVVEEGGGA